MLSAKGQAGHGRESRRVHVCVLESVFVLGASRRFGDAPGSPGRQGEQGKRGWNGAEGEAGESMPKPGS